jgi:hypothetical protein
MLARPRERLCFIAANGLAIIAFLLAGSRLWVDRRITNIPGEALGKYFAWELFSALLFVLVIAATVAAWVISARKRDGLPGARAAIVVTFVAGCWLAVIWFDAAHRVID